MTVHSHSSNFAAPLDTLLETAPHFCPTNCAEIVLFHKNNTSANSFIIVSEKQMIFNHITKI